MSGCIELQLLVAVKLRITCDRYVINQLLSPLFGRIQTLPQSRYKTLPRGYSILGVVGMLKYRIVCLQVEKDVSQKMQQSPETTLHTHPTRNISQEKVLQA